MPSGDGDQIASQRPHIDGFGRTWGRETSCPINQSYRTFLSRNSRGAFARFPEHKVPWPPGSTRQPRIRGCVKTLTATEHVDRSSPERLTLKAARVVSPMYGGPERRSGYAPQAKRRFHTASILQMTDAHLLAANARGERHRWCRNAPPARLISQANNSRTPTTRTQKLSRRLLRNDR